MPRSEVPNMKKGPGPGHARHGGRRCVVGGCSNSSFEGYALYPIKNMKSATIREQWYSFIVNSRRDFDRNAAVTVYLCDGHFNDKCFNQSHLAQFNMKCRSLSPQLQQSAVPTYKIATAPHFPKTNTELQQHVQTSTTRTAVGLAADSPKKRRRSRYQLGKEAQEIIESEKRMKSQGTGTDESNEDGSEEHMQIDEEVRDQQSSADDPLVTQLSPQLAQPQLPLKKDTKDKILQVTIKPKRKKYRSKGTQQGSSFVSLAPSSCPTCGCGCQVGQRQQQPASSIQSAIPASIQPIKPEDPSKTRQMQTSAPFDDELEEDEEEDDEEDPDSGRESDPDWNPTDEEEWYLADSDDEGTNQEEPYVPKQELPQDATKYIVFEDQLMSLFILCPLCQGHCTVTKYQPRSFGSLLKIGQKCLQCGNFRNWESQPRIGDVPAGNLMMSAAVLFAGASPSKFVTVTKHMGLKGISLRTFHKHQARYLEPTVVRTWKKQQAELVAELKESGEPLVLAGDGRADSPGHCAKYGLYTVMDMKRCKIVDAQLVQSTEVANSNNMELEGLKRCLAFLKDQGLTVKTLITDRHQQIAKYMRENHPDVEHMFDVWHIAKSVKKQLVAGGRTKGCEEIADWRKAVTNHLYWSATSTPSGDGGVMAAKFRSLANHVKNVHTHHGEHPEVDKCSHVENITPRQWMKEDSKAYDKLSQIILSPYLKRSLVKMSPLEQTSKLEAFHSLLCFWAPKLLAFSYPGMKCRSYLACLHWNENGEREQATKADGSLMWRLVFPKSRPGEYTVKKVLKPCTYGYIEDLMTVTVTMSENREKNASATIVELKDQPALCANYERPNKAVAVQQQLANRRYGHRDN